MDDPHLAKLAAELGDRAIPISLDVDNRQVVNAREHGWRAACIRGQTIVLSDGRHELLIVPTSEPNLALLAALTTAWGMGLALESLCIEVVASHERSTRTSRTDASHSRRREPETYALV